jgi:hypothetical protein
MPKPDDQARDTLAPVYGALDVYMLQIKIAPVLLELELRLHHKLLSYISTMYLPSILRI